MASCAKKDETRQFSETIGIEVNKSLQAINIDDYKTALAILDKTLEQHSDINPYEKSIIFQMKGSAHYELNEYPESIQAFEDSIAVGGLLDNEARALRVNIAQLWIGEGEYQRGAEMLEQWGRDGNELKPKHAEFIMQALIQSDNYERALPYAERWYNEANPKERKHYDLMNFLYNNLGHPSEQTAIIKDMIERWPEDKSLRDSLASMYANDGREEEAFKVEQESYRVGLLKSENDIKRIVQYHAYYKLPYDAAIILEKEMEAGRVSKITDHVVWLSVLYQDAGYDDLANMFFSEAIDMSNETVANATRKRLRALRKLPETYDPYGIYELYRDSMPSKLDRGDFKIVVSDRDAQPRIRIAPIIPKGAKKSGHCVVRFNIDNNGQPENIVARFCTEQIFKDPAIKSVRQWKYNPKIIDGRQVARSGVENRVKFWVKDEDGIVIPE